MDPSTEGEFQELLSHGMVLLIPISEAFLMLPSARPAKTKGRMFPALMNKINNYNYHRERLKRDRRDKKQISTRDRNESRDRNVQSWQQQPRIQMLFPAPSAPFPSWISWSAFAGAEILHFKGRARIPEPCRTEDSVVCHLSRHAHFGGIWDLQGCRNLQKTFVVLENNPLVPIPEWSQGREFPAVLIDK